MRLMTRWALSISPWEEEEEEEEEEEQEEGKSRTEDEPSEADAWWREHNAHNARPLGTPPLPPPSSFTPTGRSIHSLTFRLNCPLGPATRSIFSSTVSCFERESTVS
jgi:hypothetical protein